MRGAGQSGLGGARSLVQGPEVGQQRLRGGSGPPAPEAQRDAAGQAFLLLAVAHCAGVQAGPNAGVAQPDPAALPTAVLNHT